jgi:hypothetical protein
MLTNYSRETCLAAAGVLLLLICGVLSAWDALSGRPEFSVDPSSCAERSSNAPALPADGQGALRIVELSPGRVALGSRLCVAVAGVSSQAKLDALTNDLSEKQAALAKATQSLSDSRDAAAQKLADENAASAADRARAVQARQAADREAANAEQKHRQAVAGLETAQRAAEKGLAPVKLTLFLAGRRASHIFTAAAATPAIQHVSFELRAEPDGEAEAGKFWRSILAGATHAAGPGFRDERYRRLPIGLSRLEGDSPEPMTQPVVDMLVYRMSLVLIGGAGALLLIAALIVIASKTALLRDDPKRRNSPYSLARVQLAMWAVLVFFGFIFIWLVLGQMKGILNGSVLALLGISATTGLMATQMPTRRAESAAAAGDPALVAKPPESQGFFKDILNDGGDPTLPRLQMVAWSVLLAVIFVWNVVFGFSFVEFDTNLLIMMGLVGGTYVAFKPVEGGVPPPSIADAAVKTPDPAIAPAASEAAG